MTSKCQKCPAAILFGKYFFLIHFYTFLNNNFSIYTLYFYSLHDRELKFGCDITKDVISLYNLKRSRATKAFEQNETPCKFGVLTESLFDEFLCAMEKNFRTIQDDVKYAEKACANPPSQNSNELSHLVQELGVNIQICIIDSVNLKYLLSYFELFLSHL